MRFAQILMTAATQGGGGVATNANAILWRDQVVTNGGIVSAAQLALTSTLITAMETAGSWALIDDIGCLVAENATQALTSLKQRRFGTLILTPAFTIDRGYAFDGTNGINTGWIESTHASNMTTSNKRIEVYDRTNEASNGDALGTFASGSRLLAISPRNAGGTVALGNAGWASGSGTFTLPAADSRGLTSVSRNGPDVTTVITHKNGVAMVRASDPTTYATTTTTIALFIGGLNSAGSLATGRAHTGGWWSVGAQFTGTPMELAHYNAVQAYMTSKGAQV